MSSMDVEKEEAISVSIGESAMFSPDIVLYVEGRNDVLVFDEFIKSNIIIKEPPPNKGKIKGGNKQIVINIIEKSKIKGLSNVYGIIDRDFDCIMGASKIKNDYRDRLFYTDHHDLDVQIFLSPALERYIKRNFGKYDAQGEIEPYTKEEIKLVRNACMQYAAKYGYMRLTYHENGIGKKKYEAKIHETPEQYIQLEKIINGVIKKITKYDWEKLQNEFIENFKEIKEKLLSTIEKYSGKNNYADIVNGHDLIRIFAFLILHNRFKLKRKYWTDDHKKFAMKKNHEFEKFVLDVENSMRTHYLFEHFAQSELYKNLPNIFKKSL